MDKDLKIRISIDKKTGDIKVVDGEFKKLSSSVKKTDNNVDNFNKRLAVMGASVLGIVSISSAFDAATSSASDFIDIAASFESFDATLRTIEGSSQKAEKSMEWIQDFASTTPFNIDKVTSSFISLRSYGLDPTDGLLRTLGDTGSAMGKDIQQAVEAMADAVTGENERLKEFGIRASTMGEEIKYSWTNASGEMRQAIVANNSVIIQSTLESIFNSKYTGAMAEQSKTWKGLIANMQDNWTIFQKNLMSSGIFDYLKAVVTVVGEYMSNAFGYTLESSTIFSMGVIDGIKRIISSIGYTYDTLETFGDYFTFIGATADLAFAGIMVAVIGLGSGIVNIFEGIINGINWAFEGLVNGVIDSINGVLDIAASLGFGNGGTIGTISLGKFDIGGEFLNSYEKASQDLFVQTSKDLGLAWDDLMDANSGQTFVDDMLTKIDVAYEKIKNTPDITVEKEDFGDAVIPENKVTPVELEKYTIENIDTSSLFENNKDASESIENFTTAIGDLSDTIYTNDNNDNTIYEALNNVDYGFQSLDDSLETLDDTAEKTVKTVDSVSSSLEKFIFKFEDTFINSIDNNISSLNSIISDSTLLHTTSYSDALKSMQDAKSSLIDNPLDVQIGQIYTDAYDQYINSASAYLSNDNNFSSSFNKRYAASVTANEAAKFQDTAVKAVSVLEAVNELTRVINTAFSDGILTEDEKLTISGVAGEVNNKNELLLGSTSLMVAGVKAIPTSLDGQTYYDNSGLAQDNSLIGSSNSVSSFIEKLMGSENSGISLTSIASTLPDLSVATGLDMSELSNIAINTSSSATASNSAATASASTTSAVSAMAGGKTLANLQISAMTSRESYFYSDGSAANQSNYHEVQSQDIYSYYAQGGFTGKSSNNYDFTGHRPAGIVHEDEWVAPKWMVESNPSLFASLEESRIGKNSHKKFSDGGFTTRQISIPAIHRNNANDKSKVIEKLETIIKKLEEQSTIQKEQLEAYRERTLLNAS